MRFTLTRQRYSNQLNINLPKLLREVGGVPLHVRVGGGSQNRVTWTENQEEGLIPFYQPGTDKAYNTTVGPKFAKSFDVWPMDTKWALGLPFEMTEQNFSFLETGRRLAKVSFEHLGGRLSLLEIGNEWGGGAQLHPERTYSPAEYIEHWSAYAHAIAKYAFGNPDAQIWQVGSFHSPSYDCQGALSCWTTDTLLQLGINHRQVAKVANTHQYMEDAWSRPYVTDQFLMNHNNTQGTVDWHRDLAANASTYGLTYELGETNSLSGHGKIGVSDTYAATLWMIDYVLYSAQTDISRLYMHQGTGWKYSAWNPVTAFGYSSGILGTYYSYLFTYTLLSGGNKQVELLVGDKTFVAYAIYDAEPDRSYPSAIVAINLEAWKANAAPGQKPYVELELPTSLRHRNATVRRLTAPGTNVNWGITFAGQSMDGQGKINGTMVREVIGSNGWLGHNSDSAKGKMVWGEFAPKKWEEDDVDIEVTHCGMCGTDLHVLHNGWENTPYPCCVGHEIVGKAVRVGKNVTHIQVGDRVGVGAQALSCSRDDCPECAAGLPNYCAKRLLTYASIYPDDKGKSFGGYADHNRSNSKFVVKIPEGLPSEAAAPMLCAGVTMFAPLRRLGCGPGKSVGIVGVGGLGHFGILFAKALGADRVVGMSRKGNKRDDALSLGADHYIATDEDTDWTKSNARSLDIIICTISSAKMPLTDYLSMLKVGGHFVQVGAPDDGNLPAINAWTLFNGVSVTGSFIGSPGDIGDMFEFAAEKQIKPWIQTWSMADANQAIVDLEEGKPRYRYVLVNEKHL
ncbi:putative nadp-dependent alcohol dehydrogenase protein [Colletotrichum karsti]|uniref:alcohol dehydrogenase (NADP(+)) n=1 Tax=Colletotrichum karsti TaxID=1095194 RepID=A0A9P6LFQ0_9PEZI|nr:putative nadp-dependent alcohol dehydrogenase protein [Colletotrichum karsti]KAF9874379.1 putative nadp-dependent alcohol dehydrogenase protein [Colletotrichum karsti]